MPPRDAGPAEREAHIPSLALLLNPRLWVSAAFAAIGLYAAMQHIGWQAAKAEFAQYRADAESLAADAKVRNAQEAARRTQNTQEVLDDLQTRNDALAARYASLRNAKPGSNRMPGDPAAPVQACSCPAGESDAATRCLAVLEAGDREIAKYKELWDLGFKNATPR